MGLHLYLIAAAGQRPPDGLTGVDGVPVVALEVDGLLVWTTAHARRPRPSLSRLRSHDRVVRVAAEARTPLPARFGQWFEGAGTLSRAIRERGDTYRRDLSALEGAVEFGVRFVTSGREPSPDGPADTDDPRAGATGSPTSRSAGAGRAYMTALARRHAAEREDRRREAETAARVRATLGGLVLRERVEPCRDPECVARLTHLVAGDDADAYRAALERFETAGGGLELVVTGPWPPYSFVS